MKSGRKAEQHKLTQQPGSRPWTPPDSKIDTYFQSLERELREDFTRRRRLVRDSDVKGAGNERTVGDFLQKYVQPTRVVYGKQIIDSFGFSSDELDVCVCNLDQPAPDTDLILAEGVDFVVQVKAVLTDDELDRIRQNAERLKRLTRRYVEGDRVFAIQEDIPFYIDRVPYFVLAFESRLKLKSILDRLVVKLEDLLPEHWPDSIFVLEVGAVMHTRSPLSELHALEFGGRTLMNLLQQVHNVAHRIRRIRSPLIHY